MPRENYRIGIVATSSIVPSAELEIGAALLRKSDFDVTVHPHALDRHYTYAGTDQQRAEAFFEYANDPKIDVLWAARGGYGAARLLPLLEDFTARLGPPARKKLLVGFSDVTVLHEFVRHRWEWATLHAAMPGGMTFARLRDDEWKATLNCIRGQKTHFAWEQTALRWITSPPAAPITAELVGGNLSLWQSVVGTPFAGLVAGKLLFLEDIDERPYRIDRMITQIAQSGGLDGVAAIVLGDFARCDDETATCLKPLEPGEDPLDVLKSADARERIPLRKVYSAEEALHAIFGTLGESRQIPIAAGLPVGHENNFHPLPLGAKFILSTDGKLSLENWDWMRER